MERQSNENALRMRKISIGNIDEDQRPGLTANAVSSANSTWLAFVPRNLLEQFQRVPNIWFLVISIFQLIPISINPTDSWSTVLPLCLLLVTTMGIDAWNEYSRKKQDKLTNNLGYLVWTGSEFSRVKSKQIQVGDLVLLHEDEVVPADGLLVGIGGSGTTCFADVAGIQGVANLKPRKPVDETQNQAQRSESSEAFAARLSGYVRVSPPSPDFSVFSGFLQLSGYPRSIEITENELLFRGSIVKGVGWSLMIVLYTGSETKTILNIRRPRKKISKIEREVNKWVLIILSVLTVLVVFSIITYYTLSISEIETLSIPETFVLFTLLYNNIVPISLFVVIDFVRVLQIVRVQKRYPVTFNTGEVNEDLGQVEYILADKTGTITEGTVKVTACILDSIPFYLSERSLTEHSDDKEGRNGKPTLRTEQDRGEELSFKDLKDRAEVIGQDPAFHFIRCMALCHSVKPIHKHRSLPGYLGASTEEVALVECAADLGVTLESSEAESTTLSTIQSKEIYSVIARSHYSSEVKRSRVLVVSDQAAALYVKGAPDMIEPLVKYPTGLTVLADANKLSGMRVLAMACRILRQEELEDFTNRIEMAKRAVINKEVKVNAIFEEYEQNMDYIGAVGVEEQVSEDTKDAISALQDAGIKVWVVSGDTEGNVLTASLNAGIYSVETPVCELKELNNSITCFKTLVSSIKQYVHNELPEPARRSVRRGTGLERLNRLSCSGVPDEYRFSGRGADRSSTHTQAMLANHPMFKATSSNQEECESVLRQEFNPDNVDFCLSLDRVSFRTAITEQSSKELLVGLLVAAKAVCCSRFLPQDKAMLVQIIKENFAFDPLTLAVGNGNDDIPMIQEAHVGVSLKSSSYARNFGELVISRFSNLSYLLLVHGHWNYSRMARVVLLFFYKNFILTVTTFAYTFVSDYSGQSLFDSGLLVGYNIFFTSLPVLVQGVIDEDLPFDVLYCMPQFYSEGIRNRMFSVRRLGYYSVLSVIQSLVISVIVSISMRELVVTDSGYTENFILVGTTIFIGIVFTVLIQITLDTYTYSWYYLWSILISLACLLLYLVIVNFFPVPSYELIGICEQIITSPAVLVLVFLLPLVCFALSFAFHMSQTLFRPSIIDRERSHCNINLESFKRLAEFTTGLYAAYRNQYDKMDLEDESTGIDKFSLRFKSTYIEQLYRERYIESQIKLFRSLFCIFWAMLIVWTVIEALVLDAEVLFTLMRVVMSVAFTLVVFLSFTAHYMKHYLNYNILILVGGVILKVIVEILFVRVGSLSHVCIPSFTYILFNVDFIKISAVNLFSLGLLLIEIIAFVITEDYEANAAVIFTLTVMVFHIAISLTSAYIGYALEKSNRDEFVLQLQRQMSLEKAQSILSYLLPAFVRTRVNDGARYIAADQGTVTVVFCDICDFDTICAEYTPEELTTFLDELFTLFDELCVSVGVTKIETVGKTYMACAGLKDFETEIPWALREIVHARRGIEFALSLIERIQPIQLKNGKKLTVKIGINSGPVTAGVVGAHKPQFSLVGDTVNTASRMCSTIDTPNTTQISESTFQLLEDQHGLLFQQAEIYAKGKGNLTTYLTRYSERASTDPQSDQSRLYQYSQGGSLILGDMDESLRKESMRRRRVESFEASGSVAQLKFIDCSVRETPSMKEYRINRMKNNKMMIELSIVIAIGTFLVLLCLNIWEHFTDTDQTAMPVLILRPATIVCLVLTQLLLPLFYLQRFYYLEILVVLNMALYSTLLYIILDTEKEPDLVALEVMYVILLMNFSSGASMTFQLFALFSVAVPWVVVAFLNIDAILHAANTAFILLFSLMNIVAVYFREKRLRAFKNLEELARTETEKTENLLAQMMPTHVLENLKAGLGTTDRLSNVTLLYADIVGFTSWSSTKTPVEVVAMLSKMFTMFDQLCLKHGVYKVHTIGDCYVVMGYMREEGRNPIRECFNVLDMAYSMIEVIKKVNQENNSELNMRIGIHCGEVIAGISGTNIVRYDIYGPDVLIANKMESGGDAGKVNVSEVVQTILTANAPGKYEFTFNSPIEAKALGLSYSSYFVEPVLHS